MNLEWHPKVPTFLEQFRRRDIARKQLEQPNLIREDLLYFANRLLLLPVVGLSLNLLFIIFIIQLLQPFATIII